MAPESTEETVDNSSLFNYKRDILHFALGMAIGIGIVFLVAFEKIVY